MSKMWKFKVYFRPFFIFVILISMFFAVRKQVCSPEYAQATSWRSDRHDTWCVLSAVYGCQHYTSGNSLSVDVAMGWYYISEWYVWKLVQGKNLSVKNFFWGINRAIHDGRFNTIEMICLKNLRVSVS